MDGQIKHKCILLKNIFCDVNNKKFFKNNIFFAFIFANFLNFGFAAWLQFYSVTDRNIKQMLKSWLCYVHIHIFCYKSSWIFDNTTCIFFEDCGVIVFRFDRHNHCRIWKNKNRGQRKHENVYKFIDF